MPTMVNVVHAQTLVDEVTFLDGEHDNFPKTLTLSRATLKTQLPRP